MDGGVLSRRAMAIRICVSGLVLLAALATVRAPASAADTVPAWTKARFDTANTAFNPSERWLSTSNAGSLALDWSTRINPRETPLVEAGVVYIGCEGAYFCALDATNGSVRWKTLVGPGVPSRWAALSGGTVYTNGTQYVGDMYSSVIFALDAGTGAVRWQTLVMIGQGGGPTTPIVVAEGLVVQRWKTSLIAWDAATGIQRWVVGLDAGGAPAIVNGVVYVPANVESPTLYALRATTGETLWRSEPAAGQTGTPIVSAGLVIVASHQTYRSARLSAYPAAGCGASQCAPVWSRDLPHNVSGNGAVAAGVLYQGFTDGAYAALEVATGRSLWKAASPAFGHAAVTLMGSASAANGLLFGQAGGQLYVWAAAGCGGPVCQPLWSAPVSTDTWSAGTWTPGDTVVVHGRVYVVNNLVAHESVPESAELRAFSPRQDPPPALTPPPVLPVVPPPVRTVPGTLRVPQDHLSIQRAIDASIPGDAVVVAPGVYHERIDFHGRAVEVRSAGGPEVTTIDGDGLSTVVAFHAKESRTSILRGFTVRNGDASPWGGGIRVYGSSPTIVGNVITQNQGYHGSGIQVLGGAPAILGNQVRDNHATAGGAAGGGISIQAGDGAEVRGNVIEDNSATEGGGLGASTSGSMTVADNVIRRNTAGIQGGGVMFYSESDILFTQNVIVDNSAGETGGGMFGYDRANLLANTIAGNTAPRASGVDAWYVTLTGNVIAGPAGTSVVECFDASRSSFQRNIVFNGDVRPAAGCGDGSLGADPMFVHPNAGDYRLGRGSPAIDAGGTTSPLLSATDVAGAPRVVDGDGDGKAVVDIGAYEAQTPVPEVVRDTFHPVTPARLLDTRSGVGAPAQRLGARATFDLQVTGRGGVPAAGVSSVVLNVTVTETTATSFLTAWPAGIAMPLASNLNYVAGQTVPNLVTVKVGKGGKVSLYNNSGTTHVVADVTGWYGAGDGSPFTPVTPSRILDTRAGVGAPAGRVGPASTIPLQVTGRGGVPATGVSAVVLNVTVTEPTATSFVTAWPAGMARPPTSNLNLVAGQTVPNLVIVKVGEGGKVNLYNNAGTVHVIADVAGWFGNAADSAFTSLPPARVLDTRDDAGKPGPASVEALQVTGRGGVPQTGVSAVVLNVTVTEPTAASFLTGWPAGETRPLASNLNYVAGLTVPNLVVVKVGEDGKVNLYNYDGWTHVIADVAGWYG